jgi:hypothetical protein
VVYIFVLLHEISGLDDRAIGVRSPAGAKDFSSSLCVQTGSGAHPASCTMGLEFGDGAKIYGYGGTNAEILCA